MWHLTQLSFENYRTFERPETIDLCPLTVLIGRNSSGKSAIARLPLLLSRGLSGDAEAPLDLEFDDHDFGASFTDLVTHRIGTRGITLGATASDGENTVRFKATIGYWQEFNLQGIREFFLEANGESTLQLSWNGQGDPRAPGLAYEGSKERYEPGELFFRGLRPYQNFDLGPYTDLHGHKDFDVGGLVLSELAGAFVPLRYLGPFRDAPSREDRIPESLVREMGPRGSNAPRMLANDWLRRGGEVLRRVGQWYKMHLGGWQLDLERDGQRFSVILRSPNDPNVIVNLRDAGVGLSQVLPVVVQHEMDRASGASGGLNIVEQPELHLHPGAHGDLADLYIEAATSGRSRFLIETHAENFILRIRRRIAETGHPLSPEDVALYWINDDTQAAPRVKRIGLDAMGGVDFWPRGVFAEDLEEIQAIHQAQKERSV
jgi:AAA ATPase domain